MVESLVEEIIHEIDQAAQLYYRLILVVAPSGMGKTKALREIAKHTEFGYTNIRGRFVTPLSGAEGQSAYPLGCRYRRLRLLLAHVTEDRTALGDAEKRRNRELRNALDII